jgi:hypothetical protein
MVRKKRSKIEQEYYKERKRIQNYINKKEKQDFYYMSNLPNTPKKITKASVNRLKKLTAKKLVSQMRFLVDRETGESTSGERGIDILRSRSAKKAAATRKAKKKAEQEFFGGDVFDNIPEIPTTGGVNISVRVDEVLKKSIETLFELENESAWVNSKGKYIRNDMKNMVQRKVADIRTVYEHNKSGEYFHYLNENAERINNLIDTALRDSEQNIIELSLTQLYTIFARTYTLSDLKNIENEYGE